ncbi:terpene synthase family protein [Archangium gephyra]|uniref:terpene synthase family protein n=1 Tax=Archangium gephyra TaxID=48 RepID=UPI003B80826F
MSSQKESALRSKYLEGLPDKGAHVFALTQELSAALRPWMDRHDRMISLTTSRDIMRNARAKQLCLTLAAAAPFLDVSRLMPATCMGTWFFVVDELTDEHGLTSSAQWGKLVGLHALFSPGRQDAIDTQGDERLAPLLEALSDLRGLLRQYPIFETLSPELARALEEGLSGMRAEALWSAGSSDASRPSFPSLEEYLEKGALQTTGVIPVCLCMISAIDDPSIRSHLPRLLEMAHQVAICVRLANDLRTYEKELAQGKLNALGIVQQVLLKDGKAPDAAAALALAREAVQDKLSLTVKRCMELGGPESREKTQTMLPERFMINLVAFVCDFYTHHDYHHVLVRQDGNELDAGTSSQS